MSKYFDCDNHEDEASVLSDGTFNFELWAHYMIAYMSDNDYDDGALEECFQRVQEIMHWRSPAKSNKEQLDGPPT